MKKYWVVAVQTIAGANAAQPGAFQVNIKNTNGYNYLEGFDTEDEAVEHVKSLLANGVRGKYAVMKVTSYVAPRNEVEVTKA